MKVSIKVKNVDEAIRLLKSKPDKLRKELGNAVSKSVLISKKEAKKRTPVATGELRTSIRTKSSQLEGEIFSKKRYAIYVHENKKARHTVGEAKYLLNAVKNSRSKINKIFEDAIKEVLKK